MCTGRRGLTAQRGGRSRRACLRVLQCGGAVTQTVLAGYAGGGTSRLFCEQEEEDEQRLDLPAEAWLQTADWQMPIEQELCLPQTVYADLATMELGFVDRGPVGLFFSGDEIVPTPETVGRARVQTDTTVSVYQWSSPNAATPVWWQLYDGDEVEVLAVHGAFGAVAIPIGVSECVVRPEDMGHPYNGPCATGWVDQQYLQMIQ